MSLAEWSPRRLAVIWALGIALQVVMLGIPMVHAKRLLGRDGLALRQRVQAQGERDQGQAQADSVSRHAQRDSARATGQYRIAAGGDTVFAVVGMPSNLGTPEQVAARRASMERTTRRVLLFWFGTIPLALIGLTLAWIFARRRDSNPGMTDAGVRPLLMLLVALAGCGSGEKPEADAPPVLAYTSAPLRIVAGADTLRLVVELARSAEQQRLGLMERRHLADSAGMIFLYGADQPGTAGFWMFRTRIPLDIAFADSLGTIRAIQHMVPCETTLAQGCPSYPPGVPYRAALEVNAGYFARNKVAVGSQILLGDVRE